MKINSYNNTKHGAVQTKIIFFILLPETMCLVLIGSVTYNDQWGVGGRGGGGTGIEGAESGVEGAESGIEGAGSGSRGGGKRGNCGRGSGKIGGRNCFFY